jgi:hypothetical protein
MSNKVPKQFELPQNFLPDLTTEYIPGYSHDESEAQRRRNTMPGSLVYEQQHRGAEIAESAISNLVRHPADVEDLHFGVTIVSAALWGTARILLQRGEPVMRRHFELPLLADPDNPEKRDSAEEKAAKAIRRLIGVTEASREAVEAMHARGRLSDAKALRLGHMAGEAALWVSLLPLPNLGSNPNQTPMAVQHTVRNVGLDSLELARNLGDSLRENPTLAMLGGSPTNPLNAYIERSHRTRTYTAFHVARLETEEMYTTD